MRSSKLVSFLLILAAVVALVVTKEWPTYQSFLVGSPVFADHSTTEKAAPGSEVGTLALHRGDYYLVHLQSEATVPFQIFFSYGGDQARSKILIVDAHFLVQPLDSVIKADRDDPRAKIMVNRQGRYGTQEIDFHDLRVTQLSSWFYVWRRVSRTCAVILLLAACAHVLWRALRRRAAPAGSAVPQEPEAPKPAWWGPFWSVRRIACWAACLLLIGICFDAFFLRDQHSHLYQDPYQSSIAGWDPSFYYFWLRSVMVDGDVDFRNDLLYCNTMAFEARKDVVDHWPRTKTGMIPDKYPIGWALLEVPWYLAADLTAQSINAAGGHVLYDGWGPVYQTFLVLGQIVYATASLYFAFRILTQFLPRPAALCGLMLGWMGSPLFFYQTIDVGMSHNVMFFAMTGAYYFAYRLRERPKDLRIWVLVGLLCAFVILARYQGAIMLLFPGLVCLQEVVKDFRRITGFLLATVAGAIPLSLQLVAWKYMFGSYFLYTYQGETFNWRHPHIWEVLFSPFHGLFNWHPMMLVGFAGFLVWAVTARRFTEAICFTGSLALAIYVNGAWDCWWFGASFGSRAFETCTLFSMIGIGFLLNRLALRPIAFQATAAALLILALWNMNMVSLVQFGHLTLEQPLTWKQRWDATVNYWPQVY